MKKITIWFSGMGGCFNPYDNFIINILKKHFKIELSKTPDYLFYSVNSKDYLKYNCIRIFYTAENLIPDFNICDYAIGYHYLDFGDRYIRYPIYLVDGFIAYKNDDYANDLYRTIHKHEQVEEALKQKTDFCSFVYSNEKASQNRRLLFEKLSKYKKVNSGGRYLNNIGELVSNKLEFQLKHKFAIAFENTSTPGYTTEKIVNAFSANTVPIYWGNPLIGKEFNEEAFINCHKFGLVESTKDQIFEEIIEYIKEIDQNDSLYYKMLSANALTDENNIEIQKKKLELFLINIISQNKEEAYRRNRFYWGQRYERKQKIGMSYYYFLRKFIPLRDFTQKIFRSLKHL